MRRWKQLCRTGIHGAKRDGGSVFALITHRSRYPLRQSQRYTTAQPRALRFVLIINEALYFGESLTFSLLSPNQLRDNDVHVDERHRQHAPDSIFGIKVPSEHLAIPFDLDGVIAGFTTRQPTQAELDDVDLHVELTSDVEWIPSSFCTLARGGLQGKRFYNFNFTSSTLTYPQIQVR